MRWIIMITTIFLLSGCLQNVSLDGIASTAVATTAAVIGTTVGGPTVGVIAGAASGVATDVVTVPAELDVNNFSGDDGVLSFTELIAYMWTNFTSHIITIGIVAGLFWILTGYLGMRMRRPEEKQAAAQISMLVDKIGQMKEK